MPGKDLIGQEHVTKTLANAIAQNRVAHAFLFTGVRGVGKTTSARSRVDGGIDGDRAASATRYASHMRETDSDDAVAARRVRIVEQLKRGTKALGGNLVIIDDFGSETLQPQDKRRSRARRGSIDRRCRVR